MKNQSNPKSRFEFEAVAALIRFLARCAVKAQIGRAVVVGMLAVAAIAGAGPLDAWSSRNPGISRYLFGSTYANGLFIVVGEGGTILTSTDGTTWTSPTPVTSEDLYDVAYGNGVFVATGGSDEETLHNALVTSQDGVTWTSRTVPAVGPIFSLTYGGGKFVALGYTEFYEDTISVSAPLVSVLVSGDGLSWTKQSAITNAYLPDITYAAGTFVAVGDDYSSGAAIGRPGLFTSQDGVSWTQRVVPYGRMEAVGYGNGLFVVMGQDGTILTSSNGVAWTNRHSGTTNFFRAVAYGGGTFVAVAAGLGSVAIFPNTSPSLLRSSTNGIDWVAPTTGFSNACPTISYGSGNFVVAGYNGTIARWGFIGPAVLTASRYHAGTGFELTLRGELGRHYQLQALTDLGGTNWSLVRGFTLAQPASNIVDGAATNTGRRFYRAVTP
jgi:hypothetical protein